MDSFHLSMSWDSFLKAIREMKAVSDTIGDDWLLNLQDDDECGAYLSKKLVKSVSSSYESADPFIVTYNYHIVYSPVYGCPVLCFNAWKTNGNLLTIEECWKQFGFANFDHKYRTLTQMDHPVLRRPFITLHPCKTSELLGALANSNNLVVSWLSAVGPVVGLDVASSYETLTRIR